MRLLLMIVFPVEVMAYENDNPEKDEKQNALTESQKQTKIFTMSDFILKNTASVREDGEDRSVKGYSTSITAEESVDGKETDITVTGYSSTPDQCSGNPFITASGARVHKGTMACPPEYPFGTKIEIEGMGTYVCEDRGGAIKGNHFDMWFESRGEALNWGVRTVKAKIDSSK